MMTRTILIPTVGLLVCGALGQPLTIREIQSNTVDGDLSVYDGQLVDCVGGICVGKSSRFMPRLILIDPNSPDAWGGIQVRDWSFGSLADNVSVGDWVSLTNVVVEEVAQNTVLQWKPDNEAGFAIISQNNPLPPAIAVDAQEIPAPVYDPDDDGWYVSDHAAEPYESMRLMVYDVTVTEMDLGKAVDNYDLVEPDGDHLWAADYMNADIDPSGYHPWVTVGQEFCVLRGVLEQYTNLAAGWDYYQLVTFNTEDLMLCGDLDHDGDVDLADLAILLSHYGTVEGAGFEDGDLNHDGAVDLADLAIMLSNYQG